jgi:Histidine kinase/Histidine kinase-, DNA gyrase B-, and HSP90-like ATPase
MTPQLAGAIFGSSRRWPSGFWRSAFAGLTPHTFAIVAALMFARSLAGRTLADVSVLRTLDIAFVAKAFVGLTVATLPMLLAIVVTANLGPQRGTKRFVALATAIVLSACAAIFLRIAIRELTGLGPRWDQAAEFALGVGPRYVLLGVMLTVAFEFQRREMVSVIVTQQAAVDRAAFEREMSESRLRLLQAQIEPHFLFNTLATVRRLYETDHAAGRTMLGNLIRYLEIALPQMRVSETSLGGDAELAHAYLQIQQARMGRRLAFSIDVPAALQEHPVPPMLLLTLIENAVKHGVSPSVHGGAIRVAAHSEGAQLLLTVADSGVGFAPGSGSGTGLANIRARLAAQFGDNASLALENNELGGVTARIALPLSWAVNAS